MKLEFSGQIFEKYLDIKFHENSSSCSPFVPCAQTDWHDEANSLFSQFWRTCLKNKQFEAYRNVKVRFQTRVPSYKPFQLRIYFVANTLPYENIQYGDRTIGKW